MDINCWGLGGSGDMIQPSIAAHSSPAGPAPRRWVVWASEEERGLEWDSSCSSRGAGALLGLMSASVLSSLSVEWNSVPPGLFHATTLLL